MKFALLGSLLMSYHNAESVSHLIINSSQQRLPQVHSGCYTRREFVQGIVNCQASETYAINAGIPQGSFHFLLYINVARYGKRQEEAPNQLLSHPLSCQDIHTSESRIHFHPWAKAWNSLLWNTVSLFVSNPHSGSLSQNTDSS